MDFPLKTKVGEITVSTVDLEAIDFGRAPLTVQLAQNMIKTKRFETAILYPKGTFVITESVDPEQANKNHQRAVKRVESGTAKIVFQKEHQKLRDKRFER